MGRWDDWDNVLAAQEKATADDMARRARRAALRVVQPDETPPEPVEAPEAVLGGQEESSQPPEPQSQPDWRVRRAAEHRAAVDPVSALRLWARRWLDEHGGDR